jgi:hypothetical protein
LATKAAEQQRSHLDYLAQLVEGEAAMHENRSIERRIKNARFPVLKSLDDFKWSWPEKINRPQIPNLFRPLDLTAAAHRACQGWPRLSRPPVGLGLDWPEHGGMLDPIETEAARPWREDAARGSFLPLPREAHRPKKYRRADRHIIGNFKPLALRQIHAAANTYRDGAVVSPAVPIFLDRTMLLYAAGNR